MHVYHRESDLENHDRGLDYDLPRLLQRRGLLKLVAGVGLAGAGLVTLGACADELGTGTTATPSADGSSAGGPPSGGPGGTPPGGGAPDSTQTSDTANGELPEETAGPYPGDGSNGANVLTESGVVRSDITSSFGSSTTNAEGVPLNVTMTLNDFANDKQPLAGAAVYIWHCDREGSTRSTRRRHERELPARRTGDRRQGAGDVHHDLPGLLLRPLAAHPLRGVPQPGQRDHGSNKIATSQMALTEEARKAVYATAGYEQSVQNLSQVTLASDNVFGDGYDLQIPEITGDPTAGYSLNFTCAVLRPTCRTQHHIWC